MKLILIACIIASPALVPDAGTDKSTAQHEACEKACDTHYTKVLHECNGVAECEAYVRRDYQACRKECDQEQKDQE